MWDEILGIELKLMEEQKCGDLLFPNFAPHFKLFPHQNFGVF